MRSEMTFQLRDTHLQTHLSTTRHRSAATRLVFVDIETAGLQVWRPIIQIAAIAVDGRFRELETFEEKIQFDERQAVKHSLRKRNYSRWRWHAEARRDRDVAVDFGAFLARHATVGAVSARGEPFVVAQLVAHNAAFDAPFLRAWFERMGLFFPGTYNVFCTLHRAMWLFHEEQSLALPDDFKLGTLCKYFGVELRPDEAHDALADARATARLYQAMRSYRPQTTTRLFSQHRKLTNSGGNGRSNSG
jgi:DNA polymerase III epsilon subunit-like protein